MKNQLVFSFRVVINLIISILGYNSTLLILLKLNCQIMHMQVACTCMCAHITEEIS